MSDTEPLGMKSPFVPSWIDEAGLTPVQFRILCHLWRRADASGVCWPSGRSIAASCKINRDSVWPAIAVLEARGFVRRSRTFRNSNRYQLLVGGIEGMAQSVESAEKRGLQSAESEGLHPTEKEGRQSAEKEGCKGAPYKEIQRKKSKEGAARAAKLSDEAFIDSLKANHAFAGICINTEIGKMKIWLLNHPGRRLTRTFMVNWLNRCDKPVAAGATPTVPKINLGRRGISNG